MDPGDDLKAAYAAARAMFDTDSDDEEGNRSRHAGNEKELERARARANFLADSDEESEDTSGHRAYDPKNHGCIRRIDPTIFPELPQSRLPLFGEVVVYPYLRPMKDKRKKVGDSGVYDTPWGRMCVKWTYFVIAGEWASGSGYVGIPLGTRQAQGPASRLSRAQQAARYPVKQASSQEYDRSGSNYPFNIIDGSDWKQRPGAHIIFDEMKTLPNSTLMRTKRGRIVGSELESLKELVVKHLVAAVDFSMKRSAQSEAHSLQTGIVSNTIVNCFERLLTPI